MPTVQSGDCYSSSDVNRETINFELESEGSENEVLEEINHTIKDMIHDQKHLESLVSRPKLQSMSKYFLHLNLSWDGD